MIMTDDQRDEIARILETVAADGLPDPRDLDVALDAIGCVLDNGTANRLVDGRTYDWNGHVGLPIDYPQLTDRQMASKVRMLMRTDLEHEAVICGARDRIMALVKEKDALEARAVPLNTLRSAEMALSEAVASRKSDEDVDDEAANALTIEWYERAQSEILSIIRRTQA